MQGVGAMLLLAASGAQAEGISTGVTDLERGAGAAGIPVTLFLWSESAENWSEVARAETGDNGRIEEFGNGVALQEGTYRLNFDLTNLESDEVVEPFFPEVEVVFAVGDPSADYDIPLLLSPYGYSIFRSN
jgi:5-hydroxyisourate hydrolase